MSAADISYAYNESDCLSRVSTVSDVGKRYLIDVHAHVKVVVTQHIAPPASDDEELVLSGILIESSSVGMEDTNVLGQFWRPFLQKQVNK